MEIEKIRPLILTAIATLSVFMGGCASTAPNARFSASLPPDEVVDDNDNVEVSVSRAKGIELASYELERLKVRIEEKIGFEREIIQDRNPHRALEIEVIVTKYEKGSAAARAMLAGLGQMQIDCKVKVIEKQTKEILGAFDIDKTFAWGGIYGASTSMEDIEHGLAEGIARAVCGTSSG